MQKQVTSPLGAYCAHFNVNLSLVVVNSEKCPESTFTSLDQDSSQFLLLLDGLKSVSNGNMNGGIIPHTDF